MRKAGVATTTARSDDTAATTTLRGWQQRPSLDPSGDEPDTSCSMRFQTLFEARWIFARADHSRRAELVPHVLAVVALLFSHRLYFLFSFATRNALCRPSRTSSSPRLTAWWWKLSSSRRLKSLGKRCGGWRFFFPSSTSTPTARRIDGRIIYRERREGLCLDARNPECFGEE